MADKTWEIPDDGTRLPGAIAETDLPGLKLKARGKVRDIYDLGDRLLLVTTDRISAFDSVLGSPIPDKGRVLNQLSLFWFERLAGRIPHQVLGTDLAEFGFSAPLRRHLTGRSVIVRKAVTLPVECVVRGYLVGSGWKEYQKSGTVCGIPLPKGLRQAEKLPEPIFTPSTKAETGHDENIPFAEAERILGADRARAVRDASLELYTKAADYARGRGILIADTKFEFGALPDGGLLWIDEALTPDSSRFWPADAYAVGSNPPSFDKQYLRDWLENESGWDKEPPGPPLPAAVVEKTRAKYIEAFEQLTGRKLEIPA